MSENKPLIIALVVVGLLIIGYLVYLFTASEPEKTVVRQPVAIPQVKPEPVIAEPEIEAVVVL